MSALLTVDWDAFNVRLFEADPETRTEEERKQLGLYDWGHRESLFFIHGVWLTRAAGFLRNGLALPGTTGEEGAFWARCAIAPDAKLYYSESHLTASHPRIREGVTEVVNFDAHHDAGYRRSKLTEDQPRWQHPEPPDLPDHLDCGNWAYRYLLEDVPYRVLYPRWRGGGAEGAEVEPDWRTVERVVDGGGEITSQSGAPFAKVHVCRSGAWVPPWNDRLFRAFLYTLAPASTWRILGPRTGMHLPVRPWDEQDAVAHARWLSEAMTTMREAQVTLPGS
jgi:hypothetical protein